MKVDTAELRRTHVEGWRPRQSVEIDVETLKALLDELDELRAAFEADFVMCEECGKPAEVPTDAAWFCRACAADLPDAETPP